MRQHNVSSTSFNSNLQEEVTPYKNCDSLLESDVDIKSDSDLKSDKDINFENDADSGDSDIDDNTEQGNEDELSKDKLEKLDKLLKERAEHRRILERENRKR